MNFYFGHLSNCQDSRSISIKVKDSVTEQPKLDKTSMHTFLGVIWGHFLLGIWEFLPIIESS